MSALAITPFGIIYIVCAIIAFCRSYQAVAALFAFSYLFQTTAVFSIGNTGFMPYLIAPILLIIKGLHLKKEVPQDVKNIQTMSFIFIAFIIIQSFFAKYFFEGNVMVYEQGGMETAIAKGMVPYHFSMKQCIQWIYLMLNMGGLVSIIKHKNYLKKNFSRNLTKRSIIFIVVIGIWKYIADNFGGWFPETFFFNNTSYDLGNLSQSVGGKLRFTSLFIEASICGLFLAVFWWNVFYLKIKNKAIILTVILICLLLTVASTGFFGILFGFLIYLITKRNVKFIITLIVMGAILYWTALQLNLLDVVYDMTIYKTSSERNERLRYWIRSIKRLGTCINAFRTNRYFRVRLVYRLAILYHKIFKKKKNKNAIEPLGNSIWHVHLCRIFIVLYFLVRAHYHLLCAI